MCDRKIGPFDCCSVVQGDCLTLMKLLPDGCVDAVITDPPYFVGVDYGQGKQADFCKDATERLLPYFLEAERLFTQALIWSPGTVNMVRWITATQPRWIGSWYKSNQCSRSPLGFGAWEPICFYFKRMGEYQHLGRDAWDIPIAQQPDIGSHPCPKLLDFWQLLIASDTQIVFDPFLGSGTTAVAAKKLGRHFLGFEISEEYCQIARERLARIDAQPNLFEPQAEQMRLA